MFVSKKLITSKKDLEIGITAIFGMQSLTKNLTLNAVAIVRNENTGRSTLIQKRKYDELHKVGFRNGWIFQDIVLVSAYLEGIQIIKELTLFVEPKK
ncbi:13935_t:CDS:2, partial [Racocetra persica]